MSQTGEFYFVASHTASTAKTDTLMPINNDPSFAGLYRVTTYEDFFEKDKDKATNSNRSDADSANNHKAED